MIVKRSTIWAITTDRSCRLIIKNALYNVIFILTLCKTQKNTTRWYQNNNIDKTRVWVFKIKTTIKSIDCTNLKGLTKFDPIWNKYVKLDQWLVKKDHNIEKLHYLRPSSLDCSIWHSFWLFFYSRVYSPTIYCQILHLRLLTLRKCNACMFKKLTQQHSFHWKFLLCWHIH